MITITNWRVVCVTLARYSNELDIKRAIETPCPGNPQGYHTERASGRYTKRHECINCGLEWIDGVGVVVPGE